MIGLYNPASHQRTAGLGQARAILLRHRDAATPVGIVKAAFRDGQEVVVTDLEHLLDHPVGMLSTVLVGSSQTRLVGGCLVTPRGYTRKYDTAGAARAGQRRGKPLAAEKESP